MCVYVCAECPAILDVVLLLDLSGSVEAEYNLIMDFARALAVGLPVNTDAVRVGVVAFSDNVSRIIYLNEFAGQQRNLIEALNFRHHRGRTNIQVARSKSASILKISVGIIAHTQRCNTCGWYGAHLLTRSTVGRCMCVCVCGGPDLSHNAPLPP